MTLNKAKHSPYLFTANSDGTLDFEITIRGSLSRESVAKSLEHIQRVLSTRMRFDENAIQIDDLITSMPKSCSDTYIAQCIEALSMPEDS